MHLAYVSTRLAPFDQGGPASVAYGLLKCLLRIPDLKVTLITGDHADEEQILTTFGDEFEDIIIVPVKRPLLDSLSGTLQKMGPIHRTIKDVDVVHVNLLSPLRNFFLPFFALTHSRPISCTFHSVGGPNLHSLFAKESAQPLKASATQLLILAHRPLWRKIVINSQFVRAIVSKFFDDKKLFLISNGIDSDGIAKARRLDLAGDIKLFFSGNLKPVKGLDMLLKALAILDQHTRERTMLYVAGSGVYENEYRSMTKNLRLDKNVQFLGSLPLRDCYSLYKSCDIFVMPSRFESCPLSLLEAMGTGMPIIATAVGGIPEIVEDRKNGFLVSPDHVEIMKRIKYLIDHPEIRKQMSRNNCTKAKGYSWNEIAPRYVRFFRSMLD